MKAKIVGLRTSKAIRGGKNTVRVGHEVVSIEPFLLGDVLRGVKMVWLRSGKEVQAFVPESNIVDLEFVDEIPVHKRRGSRRKKEPSPPKKAEKAGEVNASIGAESDLGRAAAVQ